MLLQFGPMGARSTAWLQRIRGWWNALDFALARRFGLATREDRLFFLLVGLVGVIAGVGGVAIHTLIDALQKLLWGSPEALLETARHLPWWHVMLAPALGGVLIAGIVWLGRQPVGGGGMAMLIESVALSGGKIPARPVLINALAAIATVGSGGSLGREGPMIRLGAMISSWMGERLGLPAYRLKVLVGCGAAAGLAAAYNIPIGGALFAMEVILGNFALEIFGPIVASSVISTLISRGLSGDTPRYAAPGYTLLSGWELLPYIGLGLVGAVASVVFVLGVRGGRRFFNRLTWVPEVLHPVLGMALLGVMAIYVPDVLGGGYDTINLALAGKLALPPGLGLPQGFTVALLLGLALAKLVATALTAGSGGSGGLFTPSLFFGALVGGAYGFWMHSLLPGIASPYGAYALVGMAAVAAGTSHAPISAILILFEFTGNYDLILPLMVAAITASLVARRLRPYSLHTESLRRRGVDLSLRMEEVALAGLKVADLARPDLDLLKPGDGYRRVVETFLSTRRQRLFVVDGEGRLRGAVSLHDIKHSLDSPELLTAVVAHDLMAPVPPEGVISHESRLHQAVAVFARSDFERLPVVDARDRFQGVLAKRDLLALYAQEVLGRPAMLATFASSRDAEREYVEIPPDFSMEMVPAPAALVGKTLAETRLPQLAGVRVIEIKRRSPSGDRRVIPEGGTVLEAGDLLVLLGPTAAVEALRDGQLDQEAEAALEGAGTP
jgi:chloride channel protein, CIC family